MADFLKVVRPTIEARATRAMTSTMRRAEPFWGARGFTDDIRTHTPRYAPGFSGEKARFYLGVGLGGIYIEWISTFSEAWGAATGNGELCTQRLTAGVQFPCFASLSNTLRDESLPYADTIFRRG